MAFGDCGKTQSLLLHIPGKHAVKVLLLSFYVYPSVTAWLFPSRASRGGGLKKKKKKSRVARVHNLFKAMFL